MASISSKATPQYDADGNLLNLGELITYLTSVISNSSTMVSLVVHHTSDLPRTAAILADELGSVYCIRSRRNRLAVVAALTAARQKLLECQNVPSPGVAIFCGMAVTSDGQKEMDLDFRLPSPMPDASDIYRCDRKFHTEALVPIFVGRESFRGLVVLGHDEALLVLQSSCPPRHCVIARTSAPSNVFSAEKRFPWSPAATRRGGKRQEYIEQVAVLMAQHFLDADHMKASTCRPFFRGVLLGGITEFVTDLATYDHIHPRFQEMMLGVADVMSEEDGFAHAEHLLPLVLEYDDILHNSLLPEVQENRDGMDSYRAPLLSSSHRNTPGNSHSEAQVCVNNTQPRDRTYRPDKHVPPATSRSSSDAPEAQATPNTTVDDYVCYIEDSITTSADSTAPMLSARDGDDGHSDDDFILLSHADLDLDPVQACPDEKKVANDDAVAESENAEGCSVM